jgi:Protein of unknown function (DUF669)
MPNLSDILNRPFTGYEAPKALPAGTYTMVVTALPESKVSKNLNKYLQYKLRVVSAGPDVDEDELAEFGTIDGKTVIADFYYETDFGFSRLTSFLAACNAETGVTMEEATQSVVGSQLLVNMKQEPNQKGDGMRAVVGDFASI